MGDHHPVPAVLLALTLPVDSRQTDRAQAQVLHLRRCGPQRAGSVMCETEAHSPSPQGSHSCASRLKPSSQIFTRFSNKHCAKNNRFYIQMKKYAQKNIKAISSFMHFCRRTPPGVRGLKSTTLMITTTAMMGRTPPGVRGLKYYFLCLYRKQYWVAPHPGCVD